MNLIEKLADVLLKPFNIAVVFILGAYTFVWGLWVANPFWAVFEQAKLYSALVQFAPDWLLSIGLTPEIFWGGVAIFCGIVIARGAIKRSYRALVIGASVAFYHWLTISTFYFLGDWQNTGGITALAFAVYASVIYLNLKVNHDSRGKSMDDIIA
jgi:hypothetical protein